MVGQFSWRRSLAAGFGLSLLGGTLVALVVWALPSIWTGGGAALPSLLLTLVLAYAPGLMRVVQLWRTGRRRQAWFTLGGCTIGVVVLGLLATMLVLIAVGEALPRHD